MSRRNYRRLSFGFCLTVAASVLVATSLAQTAQASTKLTMALNAPPISEVWPGLSQSTAAEKAVQVTALTVPFLAVDEPTGFVRYQDTVVLTVTDAPLVSNNTETTAKTAVFDPPGEKSMGDVRHRDIVAMKKTLGQLTAGKNFTNAHAIVPSQLAVQTTAPFSTLHRFDVMLT